MDTMRSEIEKKLKSSTITRNLIAASLFLAAYELLKSALIDDLKNFYVLIESPEANRAYAEKVLARDKSPLIASCLWLQHNAVLTAKDLEGIKQARDMRNRIAHELPTLLLSPAATIHVDLFHVIQDVLLKVCLFWIRVDADCDPESVANGVDDSQIVPGRIAALCVILKALGVEPEPNQDVG